MAALLDLHPDTDAVSSAVADLHAVIDRLHTAPLASSQPSADVAEVDRAIRRLESLKLKLVAAADSAGVAKDAGFTGADAWLAKTTTVSRADAARQVALAGELDSGHDATAEALDAGLVSPEHAAVIVRATGQLPDTVTEEQRQMVEASLVEKAARFSPDQLRRLARRAIEAVEPDQTVVDAHENELLRSEEQAARATCSLTLHDNGDGTTTGHFTIPALAAAMLGTVIDAMTAPRRMREPAAAGSSTAATPDRSFDWRHRRGLAFAELLEHLPTDHLHPKTAGVAGDRAEASQMSRRSEAGDARLGTPRRRRPHASTRHRRTPTRWTTRRKLERRSRDARRRSLLNHREGEWPKASNTPPAPPTAANAPTPGASSTTDEPWSRGGRTDLADAIPLCSQHHHWIHDTGYNHQTLPDGSVRFSRRI